MQKRENLKLLNSWQFSQISGSSVFIHLFLLYSSLPSAFSFPTLRPERSAKLIKRMQFSQRVSNILFSFPSISFIPLKLCGMLYVVMYNTPTHANSMCCHHTSVKHLLKLAFNSAAALSDADIYMNTKIHTHTHTVAGANN